MTMLDRMRRHKNILKWSLAVVVLTFILLYIPDFVSTRQTGTGAAAGEVVAEVAGREVTAREFQQREREPCRGSDHDERHEAETGRH